MIWQVAEVVSNEEAAPGHLRMTVRSRDVSGLARPGQFVHVKCTPQGIHGPPATDPILRRPFSIAGADRQGGTFDIIYRVAGRGSRYLSSLVAGDRIDLIGPLGNGFDLDGLEGPVLMVGGGTGVAPLIFLARELKARGTSGTAIIGARSREFLLGVEDIRRAGFHTVIATDDGSAGVAGTAIDALAGMPEAGWSRVFACGPIPMLATLAARFDRHGIPCQVSLEERMACGVGACLGCACVTKEGPRRVCKDGPVFYACDLVNVGGYTFGAGASRAAGSTAISGEYLPGALRGSRGARPAGLSTEGAHPSLEVRIGPMVMKNPVMVSSGTFGFGEEYAELFDVSRLGAIVAKGITLLPRDGNPPPRIAETPSGMLNAIGLQNPGLDRFISEHLPRMSAFGVPVIVNVAGESLEEFKIILSRLDKEESVAGIELNVSCPNVASGGMAFGRDPGIVYDLTRMARRTTCRALIVKLSPNVTDIAAIARAAEMGGADAVSLINTLAGCAIDVEDQSFRLSNITGGLSGPAIRPVAVRMVGDVFRAVNIPVIGMGGIVTWQDALEFILAGATAVSVGMGSFVRPTCAVDVADGIRHYMAARGILSVEEMVGLAWRRSQIQRA